MNQAQTENNNIAFDRCLLDNDVAQLRGLLDQRCLKQWWVIEGLHKAALNNNWECIEVLVGSSLLNENSTWDIMDALETALFGALERGQTQCVASLSLLIAQNDELKTVAQEGLQRCVQYNYPNAVENVERLLEYTHMEQKKDLLLTCVDRCYFGLVACLAQHVPLELANGLDPLVDAYDVFAYLKAATRNDARFYLDPSSAKYHKFKENQRQILDLLLRNVHPEVLAHRLSLEPKNEPWEFDFKHGNSALLYEWIEQQQLRATLEQVVGADHAVRKRKV